MAAESAAKAGLRGNATTSSGTQLGQHPVCSDSQAPPQAVAHHRSREVLGDRDPDPGVTHRVGLHLDAENLIPSAPPPRPHGPKVRGVAESVLGLHRTGAGVRRLRPLRRRRLRTRTPPGVDMRARNPCTFLR